MTERQEAAKYRELHDRVTRMARDLDREAGGLRAILQNEHDPKTEGIYQGRLWTAELHAMVLRAIASDVYNRPDHLLDLAPDGQDYESEAAYRQALGAWKERHPNG